ncbi:acyl-CoA thioesterase [Helicobacter equorum]|uniref:acyl-CoA thioesterase n=1 Tax=Helicobacter equorum TaxID=361872 RepID=UPI000CF10C14|nr:thioesterase family protein [Helicobacter equorum]
MQTYQVRIYFEDTDCGGIVYHTNYIKYCERARSEIFFANTMQPYSGNCGFVVSDLEAKFYASAKLGDLLEVRSEVLWMRQTSVCLRQDIYRIAQGHNTSSFSPVIQDRIFGMEVTLAFVNITHQKITKIPDEFVKLLQGV